MTLSEAAALHAKLILETPAYSAVRQGCPSHATRHAILDLVRNAFEQGARWQRRNRLGAGPLPADGVPGPLELGLDALRRDDAGKGLAVPDDHVDEP